MVDAEVVSIKDIPVPDHAAGAAAAMRPIDNELVQDTIGVLMQIPGAFHLLQRWHQVAPHLFPPDRSRP